MMLFLFLSPIQSYKYPTQHHTDTQPEHVQKWFSNAIHPSIFPKAKQGVVHPKPLLLLSFLFVHPTAPNPPTPSKSDQPPYDL